MYIKLHIMNLSEPNAIAKHKNRYHKITTEVLHTGTTVHSLIFIFPFTFPSLLPLLAPVPALWGGASRYSQLSLTASQHRTFSAANPEAFYLHIRQNFYILGVFLTTETPRALLSKQGQRGGNQAGTVARVSAHWELHHHLNLRPVTQRLQNRRDVSVQSPGSRQLF